MTSLTVPGQPPLAVVPVAASVEQSVARVTVELDETGWQRVVHQRLFHLDPEHAGSGFIGSAPGATYRLVLRLDGVPGHGADAAGLLGEQPDAGAWYAEDVQRTLPLPADAAPGTRLAEGYRTAWAPRPRESAPLLDACRTWLHSRDMQATRVDERTVLRLEGDGTAGSWVLWVETREQERVVLVWSSWPEPVPQGRRQAVMELVTRINPDLAVGAFELDLERGQVSVRTSVELGDAPLLDDLLAGLVGANVTAFDAHLPALLAVLEGVDPATALAS